MGQFEKVWTEAALCTIRTRIRMIAEFCGGHWHFYPLVSFKSRDQASQEWGNAVVPYANVGGSVDRSKVGLFGMWLG